MVNVQTFSEAGGHPQNEDAFAVREHPLDSGLWLCFVADGQGGRAGGGAAARLACQAALDAAVNHPPEQLADPRVWRGIIRSADEAVRDDAAAGLTTLVGLAVDRDRVVGASSGDSAALLVGVERVVELTSGQLKDPPVGSGLAATVPFGVPLEESWKVLAMTDGVWKYVGWDRVMRAAGREHGPRLITELEQSARLPGSRRFQDDFTVVVLEGQADGGMASGAA